MFYSYGIGKFMKEMLAYTAELNKSTWWMSRTEKNGLANKRNSRLLISSYLSIGAKSLSIIRE